MANVSERVPFKLLRTNCCGALLCWINPRFPNFCPECGARCFPQIRECVLMTDNEAMLRCDEEIVSTLHNLTQTPEYRR